ncbi:hypothetical protein CERSUDRAFT_112636, partial [Gelatoporia subvermispora B]
MLRPTPTLLALAAALFFVLSLAAPVYAAPRRLSPSVKVFADTLGTNAQRLAAGLPPLPPKRRAAGTRIVSASPSPSASPRPPQKFSGVVKVRLASNGTTIGFVQNGTANVAGVSASDVTDRLEVAFSTTGAPNAAPFNILATNPTFPAPFFVGGNGTAALGSGSANVVAIDRVGQTSPFAPPDSSAGGESAIWSYSLRTKELTARWINPDGSKPKTAIGFNSTANSLFLTGDIAAYNAAGGTPAEAFLLDRLVTSLLGRGNTSMSTQDAISRSCHHGHFPQFLYDS